MLPKKLTNGAMPPDGFNPLKDPKDTQLQLTEFPNLSCGDEPITHHSVVFDRIFESVVEGKTEALEGDDQQTLELQAIAELVVTYCQARRYSRSLLLNRLNSVAEQRGYVDGEYSPPEESHSP